ncbi:MAG: hypothetical protein J6P16_03580 [Eubacterium sp.]|nr:hypothetical protein [Eubacterium sp.]
MYKNRLRPALIYYRDLTEGKVEQDRAMIEMERLLIQISFFQHERLIHLIVTVLFGLATVITIPAYLMLAEYSLLLLGALFIVLLIPYVVHYFHLENGVQELYLHYNRLELMAHPDYKKIY